MIPFCVLVSKSSQNAADSAAALIVPYSSSTSDSSLAASVDTSLNINIPAEGKIFTSNKSSLHLLNGVDKKEF